VRLGQGLLVLAMLAPALAGCLGTASERLAPLTAAAPAQLPAGFQLDEGEVVAQNASSTQFRWASEVKGLSARFLTDIVGQVEGVTPSDVQTHLDVPAGVGFRLEANLTYESGELLFFVRDAAGFDVCPFPGYFWCSHVLRQALTAPEQWTVIVRPSIALSMSTPFEVHVQVTALPSSPVDARSVRFDQLPDPSRAVGPGWTQFGGGPEHAGIGLLPDTPLDVLRSQRVLGSSERLGAGSFALLPWAETLRGLLAVVNDQQGRCVLVRVSALGEHGVERTPLNACNWGHLVAYDSVSDSALICATGGYGDGILQMRDATNGNLRWAVKPSDLDALLLTLASTSSPPIASYACESAALDPEGGEVVVAVEGDSAAGYPVRTWVASVGSSSGDVSWHTLIPTSAFFGVPPLDLELPGQDFSPSSVTLTSTGILVTGYLVCACVSADGYVFSEEGAAAWLTRTGGIRVSGGTSAQHDVRRDAQEPSDLAGSYRGSDSASASGALGAFALGDRVLLVNPTAQRPIKEQPIDAVEGSITSFPDVAGPAWWSDSLVVPLSTSVTVYDSNDLSRRWSWTEGPEWYVSRVLVAPPGDLYVLLGRPAMFGDLTGFKPVPGSPTDARLVRLDLASGEVRERLALPMEAHFGDHKWPASLLPLADGRLLVADRDGNIAVLGQAPPSMAPRAALSDAYPAPGRTVTLRLQPGEAGPPEQYLVSWGEGPPDEVSPGNAVSHRYQKADIYRLRVTSVYADGRTATTEEFVHVGGTPPVELNALQQAFAPDNQNLTFGALGLALTGIAALVAVLVRRRKKTRLGAELRALERIRERSGTDALGAVHQLEAFRQRVLLDVAEGRLDDAQFSVLELRVARLLQALRLRLLGPFAGRVSDEYRHLLEAALEDGQVTAQEAAQLRLGLARERGLTKPERERLAGLIGLWQRTEKLPGP
jgi:hypothetical protein